MKLFRNGEESIIIMHKNKILFENSFTKTYKGSYNRKIKLSLGVFSVGIYEENAKKYFGFHVKVRSKKLASIEAYIHTDRFDVSVLQYKKYSEHSWKEKTVLGYKFALFS